MAALTGRQRTRLLIVLIVPILLSADALLCRPARSGEITPETLIAMGMPHAAREAFLLLPAADRAASPLLPRLMRELAAWGRADLALPLFEDLKGRLKEPVRSQAFLEAGRILWDAGEHARAAAAFRQVSAASPAAPEAFVRLARILAAEGNAAAAAQLLKKAPGGQKENLIAAEIAMLRRNPEEAAAAWRRAAETKPPGISARIRFLANGGSPAAEAVPELLKMAGEGSLPERTAALEAAARLRLASGDRAGGLSSAQDGIAAAAALAAAVEGADLAAWDGTRGDALERWRTLSALYPYGEDASRFIAAGRAFLARSALHDTIKAAAAGSRRARDRARQAREALVVRRGALAGRIERAEAIRRLLAEDGRRAGAMRRRLADAAASLSLAAWGERTDPDAAALLRRIDGKAAALRSRLAALSAESVSWERPERLQEMPAEVRRTLLFARKRIAVLDETMRALDDRTALARGTIWNRWKARFAGRLVPLLREAKAAADAAGRGEKRLDEAIPALRSDLAETAAWIGLLDRSGERLARNGNALDGLLAAARAGAERSFGAARRALLAACARRGRALHALAGRAATEWRIEGRCAPGDNAALPTRQRKELLDEAIRHWEASLPPPGETAGGADEALYALAELRFEEEQSRFLENERADRLPDYALPASLFRRLIDSFPDSPYREAAGYGLALCYQEAGDAGNASSALTGMLARNPETPYAAEIRLRLGEYAFDASEFKKAEGWYRKVGNDAPPEVRTTALFKLGWSLYLQSRPGDAVDPFLSAALLSPLARKTGGTLEESLGMAARVLVETNREKEAEELLARRGAQALAPPLLLHIQRILDVQNRYEEAVGIADRIGTSYPLARERIDAETAAASALRKRKKDDESHARRARFAALFGPGSPWQAAPGREPGDIARADQAAEEGLRAAAFFFHARVREAPPGDRPGLLALYDTYLSLFPASPGSEEVAYQRAWLLFEDGRPREAGPAFEAVGRRAGARAEASWYMAVQCAKERPAPGFSGAQEEVIRLCREYESRFPGEKRLALVLMDKARAQFNVKDFAGAAAAAEDAARHRAALPGDRYGAWRLAGEARFEAGDFADAEKAFREAFKTAAPADRDKTGQWIGFSMFRRAERMPEGIGAADLFLAVAREFSGHEIALLATFRAGVLYAGAGRSAEAVPALLAVEAAAPPDATLGADASRLLARLYEKGGEFLPAAARYERLGLLEGDAAEKGRLLLRSAELFLRGRDASGARRGFLAVADLPATPPDVRIHSLFQAAEIARAGGEADEADRLYARIGDVHGAAPSAAPVMAGKAFFQRAERRFREFAALAIDRPSEEAFLAKEASLDACASLYLDAIRAGDEETVSASLHRLGEAFENFRSSILASPPPQGLSDAEREEYTFLLEEKAAPIEEKAVEAYRKNLRQAVAAGVFSSWVGRSLARLKAIRPARFAKSGDYTFPTLTVPDFRGIVEKAATP